ncbi:unnamed protein product [Urochloa decumbens]|uniref:Uncharacterized protein n=1 Tax=Urochloa decumbens TaxID=240449 RepID=A0ABC9BAK2_9POAL
MGLKRARVEAPKASVERNPRPKKTILESLGFLETMKRELATSEMDKYYEFIAVMRTFKAGRMDAESVADYVKALLAGHPELIRGLSEFLPWDYIRSHGAVGGSGI